MRKIENYKEFNENILTSIKDKIMGIKTDDDRLAKKILKDIDNIDFSYVGLYPHTLTFNYDNYRFSCMSGICDLYVNGDKVNIKSKFLIDLYEKGIEKAYDKRDKEYSLEKERKRKEKEDIFIKIVNDKGGFDDFINDFIYEIYNFNKKKVRSSYPPSRFEWIESEISGVRFDSEYKKLVISSPYEIAKSGLSFISFNFESNELSVSYSYAAYSNHKEYKMIIDKNHKWYNTLNQVKENAIYVANLSSKDKDSNKGRLIKKLLNK